MSYDPFNANWNDDNKVQREKESSESNELRKPSNIFHPRSDVQPEPRDTFLKDHIAKEAVGEVTLSQVSKKAIENIINYGSSDVKRILDLPEHQPSTDRHYKIFSLSRKVLVDILQGQLIEIRSEGEQIPEGAKVVDVRDDPFRGSLLVIVEHPTFPPTPEGYEIPWAGMIQYAVVK